MAEEGQSSNEEPKTYTQEEVDTLKEASHKEGQTTSHKHWQSVADRAIAANLQEGSDKLSSVTKELEEMKTKSLEGMSSEDRNTAMIEEMYRKQNAPPVTKETPTQTPNQEDNQGSDDEAKQRNQAILDAAKAAGVDPEKINLAMDMSGPEALTAFIKSIKDASSDGEGKEDDDDDSNNTSKSQSTSGGGDLTKLDPLDIMKQAPAERIRGGLRTKL